jgi:hypothetical protein
MTAACALAAHGAARREYESIREHPRRFAVIADHAICTTEDIVERHQRYDVWRNTTMWRAS